jgi:hypothetical protein
MEGVPPAPLNVVLSRSIQIRPCRLTDDQGSRDNGGN